MQIQGFTPNTSEWFPAVRGEGRMGLGVGNRECINKYKVIINFQPVSTVNDENVKTKSR